MEKFIDREEELGRLKELLGSEDAEMAVVYGRRRIGKTELVTEALESTSGSVYYQAIETTAKDQIESFLSVAAESFPGIERVAKDWETVLEYLVEKDAVVVIDEFPYLVESDESIPSRLQRLWDHKPESSKAKLVLTGSSIGMMYDLALEGGSPLYGRLSQNPSGKIPVEEMPFSAAVEFLPSYTAEEKVLAFSIFGGTPHYLNAVESGEDISENVRRSILSSKGSLHSEPETVLRMELDEVNRYFSVLRSISRGNRYRKEIIDDTGINSSSAGYYLDRLEKLHIIEKDHPVTEDPKKSRRTRYRMRDSFFRFWFRFVYGQTGRYDLHDGEPYEDIIEPQMHDFASETFEELCQEASKSLHSDLGLKKLGKWWRNGREIDVVGLTQSDRVLVGEVKFTGSLLGYDVLSRLEKDAEYLNVEKERRYALFSRKGFKKSVQEAARDRKDLHLHDLEEIIGELSGNQETVGKPASQQV